MSDVCLTKKDLRDIIMDIGNKDWYYFLINEAKLSLAKVYGVEELSVSYVMSYQTKSTRLFALFDTIDEIEEYIQDTNPKTLHFYEVIKNRGQKPHFDIDIDTKKFKRVNGPDIVKNIVHTISKVLSSVDVHVDILKDVLVYDSTGKDKISYHIIVDNYYHADHKEAHAFYRKIIDQLPDKYKWFIDHSVYTKSQQFRLLGSRKQNSNRVKVYFPRSNYRPKHPLKSSMVSYIKGCKLLPKFKDPQEDEKVYNDRVDLNEIQMDGKDLLTGCLDLMEQKFTYRGVLPFKYKETRDKLILLLRTAPSYCEVCNREHENENPFMFITTGGLLKFSCRRKDGHWTTLGRVIKKENKDQDILSSALKKIKNIKNIKNKVKTSTTVTTKSVIPPSPKTKKSQSLTSKVTLKKGSEMLVDNNKVILEKDSEILIDNMSLEDIMTLSRKTGRYRKKKNEFYY